MTGNRSHDFRNKRRIMVMVETQVKIGGYTSHLSS